MEITKDVVANVANLARLKLTDEEMERFAKDMAEILGYFDKLSELKTEGVRPMEHVMPLRNVFREDITKELYERDIILENAPDKKDGCFRVPKIVE